LRPLMSIFRSWCSVAAPSFMSFGKSWAPANLLILVPRYRSEVPDRICRLPWKDSKSAVPAATSTLSSYRRSTLYRAWKCFGLSAIGPLVPTFRSSRSVSAALLRELRKAMGTRKLIDPSTASRSEVIRSSPGGRADRGRVRRVCKPTIKRRNLVAKMPRRPQMES